MHRTDPEQIEALAPRLGRNLPVTKVSYDSEVDRRGHSRFRSYSVDDI